MQKEKKSLSKLMIWGIALSVLTFCVYYFFFEQEVHESRLTYSVSSEEYDDYAELENYYSSDILGGASISPNYESIADSLKGQGIRRFELKQFLSGLVIVKRTADFYWRYVDLPPPELITNRYVSSSKPLNTSLGISILILAFFLVVDFIFFGRSKS